MKNVGRLTSHSYELKAGSIAHNGSGIAEVVGFEKQKLIYR